MFFYPAAECDWNPLYAPDVLRAAVHFVSTSGGFGPALSRAIAFAGGANYCPVIVGARAGARWGASRVPDDLLTHCSILPRVRALADDLASEWQ